MRLGLVSAKGSPGATTVALAAAAVTGGIGLEADPAGGDVECWAGPRGELGLIRLAGALRHSSAPDGLLAEQALEVWPGVRAVLAPAGGDQAESTLVAIGQRLVPVLRAETGWVVVDGGRWARSQPTAGRLAGCDVIAVVLSATLTAAAHARRLVAALRETFDVPVVAVLVGDRGYPPAEIASVLDVVVVGVVPWDRRGVESLAGSGASRLWTRSALARGVRTIADQLTRLDTEAVGRG